MCLGHQVHVRARIDLMQFHLIIAEQAVADIGGEAKEYVANF